MNLDRTAEQETQALARIVALLFCLACLVDLAAARGGPVGHLVLWLLRWVEAIAREFVTARPPGHRPSSAPAALARSFRALAILLRRQLRNWLAEGRRLLPDHPMSGLAALGGGFKILSAPPALPAFTDTS